MKLYYCENYVRFESFISPNPYIEQFYIMETELGLLIEFNEDGKRVSTWDSWGDYFSTWKSQAICEKDFIKVRVL